VNLPLLYTVADEGTRRQPYDMPTTYEQLFNEFVCTIDFVAGRYYNSTIIYFGARDVRLICLHPHLELGS
jgi:hypothetical protein